METLQDFLRYKKELTEYMDYFNSHYDMTNNFAQTTLKPFFSKSVPGGLFDLPFVDELGTLDKEELDDLSVKVIAIKNYLNKERKKKQQTPC